VDEGLASLTLRRVADELGVFPGLVSHYFGSVDDLLVAAFVHATMTESDQVHADAARGTTPLDRLRRFLVSMASAERNRVSLLWLDAWSTCRHHPALAAAVADQMLAEEARVAALIKEGASTGRFRVDDPTAVARRILAVVDGLSVQAAIKSSIDYTAVADLVFTTAERELGLRRGTLH
jgi:AcrR family transcriptional regulator